MRDHHIYAVIRNTAHVLDKPFGMLHGRVGDQS